MRATVGIATLAAAAACGVASTHPGGQMMGGGAARVTCAAPATPPAQTVAVTLADMGMHQNVGGTAPLGVPMTLLAAPTTLGSGRLSFVAVNRGWRFHELVILPLAAGQQEGQRKAGSDGKVSETGSLGEASASCAVGAGGGIAQGAVGWTTITLTPGRYELVCNLPNHYRNGMHRVLTLS